MGPPQVARESAGEVVFSSFSLVFVFSFLGWSFLGGSWGRSLGGAWLRVLTAGFPPRSRCPKCSAPAGLYLLETKQGKNGRSLQGRASGPAGNAEPARSPQVAPGCGETSPGVSPPPGKRDPRRFQSQGARVHRGWRRFQASWHLLASPGTSWHAERSLSSLPRRWERCHGARAGEGRGLGGKGSGSRAAS